MAGMFDNFAMDLDDTELAKASAPRTQQNTSRFFEPGEHQVQISEVTDLGVSAGDPTWRKLKVTYSGMDGRTINEFMLVPTVSAKYGPNKTDYIFVKLTRFASALGLTLDTKTSNVIIPKMFNNDAEYLRGLKLGIQVAYKDHSAQYVERGVFRLVDPKGVPVLNDQGEPLTFSDKPAAELYCVQNGIKFSKYSDVTRHLPTKEKNNLVKFQPKRVSAAIADDIFGA